MEIINYFISFIIGALFTLVIFFIDAIIKDKKQINKVHFYVARDKRGSLYLYLGKPERLSSCFVSSCGTCCGPLMIGDLNFKDFGINLDDFKDLKWEDEPVEVFLNLED